MRKLRNKLFFVAILGLIGFQSFGQGNQPAINSPFSRYGVGNLSSGVFGPQQAMGGWSAAYSSPFFVNLENPASLGSLQYTSFETGIYYQYTRLQGNEASANIQDGNLVNLTLAFPIFNPLNRLTQAKRNPLNWGMAFSLSPFSEVGYDIQTTSVVNEEIGEVEYTFLGDGQLYNLKFGNGFKYRNLSVGADIGYLFGRITQTRLASLNDVEFALRDILEDNTSHAGFIWDLGAQYEIPLNKVDTSVALLNRKQVTKLVVGFSGHSNHRISTNSESIYMRDRLESPQNDTILFLNEQEGPSTFPAEFQVGFAIKQGQRFILGTEVKYTPWSKFEHPTLIDDLNDSYRLSIGGMYTPNVRSYKVFQRTKYRAGFFYEKDPRVVAGDQLTNYGVNLGFSFPVLLPRGVPSFVNLGFEMGRIGNDQLMETYFRSTLAFTLNDNTWFFKRKYR